TRRKHVAVRRDRHSGDPARVESRAAAAVAERRVDVVAIVREVAVWAELAPRCVVDARHGVGRRSGGREGARSHRRRGRRPRAAVVLDEEQVAKLGEGRKRLPVRATVNGYSWRTTVTRMGGEFLVGLNRHVREQAGVDAGDAVEVRLELDTAPRTVEIPRPLADALARDAEARTSFERLAYTHRKEYARWIGEAKRDETQRRRIAQ